MGDDDEERDDGRSLPLLALSELDQARVIRIQKLIRGRLARKRGEAIAGEFYRKCWDAFSGFAYYYNVRTGASMWRKPLLLGSTDTEWVESSSAGGAADRTADLAVRATDDALRRENGSNQPFAALTFAPTPPSAATMEQWKKRFEDSVAFQQQCAKDKQELMKRHRKKIARAMQHWDHKLLKEKERRRAMRVDQLKADNQQMLNDLYNGKLKQNVETIREAAMRGHVDRVRELLEIGFSANAESAMGLTPLCAACQNGQYEAVKLLLANGADVNHAHVKTGRTALMEAGARANASIVKELLRYGAQLYVRDAHGETVFDEMKDPGIQKIVTVACESWTAVNAPLFPTEFRMATLAFAHIAKRQYESFLRKKDSTRREVLSMKRSLQRLLAEAKMRHDEDKRVCHAQITILRKLESLEAADARYDGERSRILKSIEDTLDMLRSSHQPRYLTEPVVLKILGYCGRHWFEMDPQSKKRNKSKRKKTHKKGRQLPIEPTKLRDPPDKFPGDLVVEWDTFHEKLKTHCALLRSTETQECADVESGVSRDSSGVSRATLDICIVKAENLPLRDMRTGEPMDPFVRVSLRSASSKDLGGTLVCETSMRLADRHPEWDFSYQMAEVPSIHEEVLIQVIDNKRQEVAGEASIPLRSLLDQKEHDEWHVLPPTLRQQLVEKQPRQRPARIHLKVKFIHTKSIVLTRELQQMMKHRDAIAQKKRDFIQSMIAVRMEKLQ